MFISVSWFLFLFFIFVFVFFIIPSLVHTCHFCLDGAVCWWSSVFQTENIASSLLTCARKTTSTSLSQRSVKAPRLLMSVLCLCCLCCCFVVAVCWLVGALWERTSVGENATIVTKQSGYGDQRISSFRSGNVATMFVCNGGYCLYYFCLPVCHCLFSVLL